jgi:hypothetical protein
MLCGIDNSEDVQELIYTTRLKIVSKEDFLNNNGKPFTRICGSLCLKYLNQIVTHKPITNDAAEIAIPIIPPEESDELELFDDGVADGTPVVPEFPLLVWLGN